MEPVQLPNAGDRFLDRWEIGQPVGKGGFSVVFRATDDEGLVAAVKILTPEASSTVTSKSYADDVADRFLREARLLDKLDSTYTIRLWDFGESADGLLYMVFEFIDGRMLFDEIKREGPMNDDRVIHVLRQTLAALESAHAIGILHRDIKPNNIMLYELDGDPDRVKLVDFGIAKMFDDEKDLPGNDLTAAGLLVGTPRYMAPEQLKGQDLGPPSDLYSLGLCAIEMLSGRKCIPGKDRVKIVERQLGPEQVRIPEDVNVGAELAAIVHKLTEKRQADRYVSATAALRDLERLAGDPGATGDTLYGDPSGSNVLLRPADENDDTVYETVNSAELAALIDQQRKAAAAASAANADSEIDPFDETMASSEFVTPELKAQIALLRATDSTVEVQPQSLSSEGGGGFGASFDQMYGGLVPDGPEPDIGSGASFDPNRGSGPLAPPPGGPTGFPPVDQSYGSGQFGQPPLPGGPPASQSYGSGQFPQPPVAGPGGPPASQSYGSGQFPQPPLAGPGGPPVDQSYGSGQFPQPGAAPYGSGQFPQPGAAPYGSGQFPQPMGGYASGEIPKPPVGGYASGQYAQPPLNQGSGQFPQPGFAPPPYGQPLPGHFPPGQFPPGQYPPGHGPPQQMQQGLSSDDKLALGAALLVPGVGQIIAGQVVKGGAIMVVLLLLVVFISPAVWLLFAPLSLGDTFLLLRAQKRRPVGPYEAFADYRDLL